MAAKASGSSGSSGSPTVLPTASEATRPRRTKAGNRLPAVMKALRESDDGNSSSHTQPWKSCPGTNGK